MLCEPVVNGNVRVWRDEYVLTIGFENVLDPRFQKQEVSPPQW
jgi:hypothetical protein